MSRPRLFPAACLAALALAGPSALAGPESPEKEPLPEPVAELRHAHPVFAVAFSPDGKRLAVGTYERKDGSPPRQGRPEAVHVWDVRTGKPRASFRAHNGRALSVTFAPDGRTLLSSGEDRRVRFWDVAGRKEARPFNNPPRGDTCLVFSPDGKTLASVCESRGHLWDAATGAKLRDFGNGRQFSLCTIVFAPDGKTLASVGGTDTSAHLWDVATGTESRTLPGNVGSFNGVAFSPDCRTLAVGGNDEVIHLWNPVTGAERRRLPRRSSHLAFSPDGRSLAAESGHLAVLWETATGNERGTVSRHGDAIHCLAFSPDGRLLATGGEDGVVRLWDVFAQAGRGKSRLSAREAEALWGQLSGADAAAAYRAARVLAASPELALPLLKKHLAVAELPAARADIPRLIRDLDSDTFAVREKATRALQKLGDAAEASMRQALRDRPSVEMRRRLQGLLARLEDGADAAPADADERGQVRGVEVLEIIGSAEAREFLDRLARGAPGARLTREAKAGRSRLAKRPAPVP